MKEATEITHDLESSFQYAFKGEQRDASFITLTAPTMKQHSQAAALKQSIIRIVTDAVRDAGDDNSDDSKGEEAITSKMVVATIYGSSCVEANVVWGQARALLKEGVALIDGEQKLTVPLMEKMSPDDFENMAGEYIANFTLA